MMDYPPNSNKYKKEQQEAANKKELTKVISGNAVRKKNEVTKFKDVFIAEDMNNIKNYILMDVLVPSFKKAVSDIIKNGIDMLLYGSAGQPGRKSTADKISYTKYYDDPRDRRPTGQNRMRYVSDDIVLDSRVDAERVLSALGDQIREFDIATIADLYELLGERTEYTDHKYGWTSIKNARVVRVSDGYLLDMPKAVPISQIR